MADGWCHLLTEADFAVLHRVDPSAWAVWLVLRWYARTGNSCYPSVATIASMVGLGERSVHYALSRLFKAGLLHREAQRGKTTIYHLLGGATDCTPADGRSASDCGTPLQSISDTSATSCGTPLQQTAAEVEALNNTHEVNPLKKKARGRAAEVSVEVPAVLVSEVFSQAWSQWLDYRRSRKLTNNSATLTGQLRKLAALGPDGAAAEIANSIEHGWQSVCYNPGGNGHDRKNGFPCGPGQRHASSPAKPGQF